MVYRRIKSMSKKSVEMYYWAIMLASTGDKIVIKQFCLVCGKEYNTYPCRTKRKFCGKRCAYTHLKGKPKNVAEKNPMWKGGIRKRKYVWVRIPEHPFRDDLGYVVEHRIVMEKYLGRYLTKNEVVHHIDGNTHNNNIENLVLYPNSGEHTTYHNRKNHPVSKLTGKPYDKHEYGRAYHWKYREKRNKLASEYYYRKKAEKKVSRT